MRNSLAKPPTWIPIKNTTEHSQAYRRIQFDLRGIPEFLFLHAEQTRPFNFLALSTPNAVFHLDSDDVATVQYRNIEPPDPYDGRRRLEHRQDTFPVLFAPLTTNGRCGVIARDGDRDSTLLEIMVGNRLKVDIHFVAVIGRSPKSLVTWDTSPMLSHSEFIIKSLNAVFGNAANIVFHAASRRQFDLPNAPDIVTPEDKLFSRLRENFNHLGKRELILSFVRDEQPTRNESSDTPLSLGVHSNQVIIMDATTDQRKLAMVACHEVGHYLNLGHSCGGLMTELANHDNLADIGRPFTRSEIEQMRIHQLWGTSPGGNTDPICH